MDSPTREVREPEEAEDYDDEDPEPDVDFLALDLRTREAPLTYWYGCRRAGHTQRGYDGVTELVGYDVGLLVTIRSLFLWTGTILTKNVLWVEEGITVVTFILVAYLTGFLMRKEPDGWEASVSRQVENMQDFCESLTTTSFFLLPFFTKLNFKRWWRLRSQGVETIWSAAARLSMVMSTFITNDERILSAIHRYTRASLMLIFMSQRGNGNLSTLQKRGLLYPDEVEKLSLVGEPMFASMSIWTWLAAFVSGMKEQGMIKSEQVTRFCVDAVAQGHNASHLMVTQLTAPVPMSYVWLISFIVKAHNFVYAVLYGIMVTVGFKEEDRFTTCITQTLFFLMVTLLFHAMLILNQELTDPFEGLSQDVGFPAAWLDRKIKQDASTCGLLAGSLPEWIGAMGISQPKEKLP